MTGSIQSKDVLIGTESQTRLQMFAREWGVVVERGIETETSLIAFGARNTQSVVLKVIKQPGDEWRSGEVLQAFDGLGVARVYEHAPGAVLMERLTPGTSLVDLVVNGKDEEATDILADVIQQMSELETTRNVRPESWHLTPGTRHPQTPFPTLNDWARGFDRYIASGDDQIPRDLVESAQKTYLKLAATQRHTRMLHGDLQHYNILFDSDRGWVAIDPKGVIGEVEYEIGAALRNPVERPDLFLSRSTIERRLNQFTNRLNLDYNRAAGWTFAQAVLSAIWTIEDDHSLDPMNPSLMLADALRTIID